MDALEIITGTKPASAVIWLHGLGADGHDFAPIVPELGLPAGMAVRFIFPHAPLLPVTINNGYVMPAWYDVRSLDLRQTEDETGIRASQQQVEALIRLEEARGIPASRIVLAGFSQGGAIALHTGLRHEAPLAGVLALSTYLPLPDTLDTEASPTNAHLPIFMAHGTADSVIPVAQGIASRNRLQDHRYRVEWREYPMAHSVCPGEITDIGQWLVRVLTEE
ncbi:MAG: alpha/beta fold hydrolase [Gammaproteobacteria bacterium]|nr:alpha/beta fold hydrolase [Gammaproteobacteria bacterium]MBU1732008.1 alpha/beta fold hydrolase [Gammaproteobacteria bacterium]MBU1894049.1 alpha/beta fold hydrolase [Gammaproteobacteria bacterium]